MYNGRKRLSFLASKRKPVKCGKYIKNIDQNKCFPACSEYSTGVYEMESSYKSPIDFPMVIEEISKTMEDVLTEDIEERKLFSVSSEHVSNGVNDIFSNEKLLPISCSNVTIKQCSVTLSRLSLSNSEMLSGEKSLRNEINQAVDESRPKIEETEEVGPPGLSIIQSDEKVTDNKLVSSCSSPEELSRSTQMEGVKFIKDIDDCMGDHFIPGFYENPVTETLSDFENDENATNALNSENGNESSNGGEDTELKALLKCVFDGINNDSDASSEKSFEVEFNHKDGFSESDMIESKSFDTLCERSEESVDDFNWDQLEKCAESRNKSFFSETSNTFDKQHDTQTVQEGETLRNLNFVCGASQTNSSEEDNEMVTKPCVVLLPRISAGNKVQESVGSANVYSMKRKPSLPSYECMKNTKLLKKKHFIPESSEQISECYRVKKRSSVKCNKVFKENKKPTSESKLVERLLSGKDPQMSSRSKKIGKNKSIRNAPSCDEYSYELKTSEFSFNLKFSEHQVQEENAKSSNLCDPSFNLQFQDNSCEKEINSKDDDIQILSSVSETKLNGSRSNESSASDGITFAAVSKTTEPNYLNTNEAKHRNLRESDTKVLENAVNNIVETRNMDYLISYQIVPSDVDIETAKNNCLIKSCNVMLERLNIDADIVLAATQTKLPSFSEHSSFEATSFHSESDKRKLESQKRIRKKMKFSKFSEKCNLNYCNSETKNASNGDIECQFLKSCSVRIKKLDLNSLSLVEGVGNIRVKISDLAKNEFCKECLMANNACAHYGSSIPVALPQIKSQEIQSNENKTMNASTSLSTKKEISNSSQYDFQNKGSDSSSCVIEWKEADSEQWTLSFNKINYVNRRGEKMSKFFCVQCDRDLNTAEDLFYHLCNGKKKQGFICEYCEKIFNSCCTLTSHKVSHVITLD